MQKLELEHSVGDKQIAKRRNENFYRISAAQLVSLLQGNQAQAAQSNTAAQQVPVEESKESIYGLMGLANQDQPV